jgi:thiamine biosynthesis lipoprotein
MQYQFQALGTKWWITIYDEKDEETLEAACGSLEGFAQEYEARYSRFKADSLVSILNRERVLEAPSEECRTLLTYGKQLYIRTNTHFNVLTGHVQEARGYDANYSFSPTDELPAPTNPVTDLLIGPDKIELTNGKIDLGGFGKGYLIDEMVTLLQEKHEVHHFLINAGGDMYATSKLGDEPIEILLEHPTKPKHFIGNVANSRIEAFAASSPFKRIWHTDSKTYSHIITKTGVPELASFVKASTARDADAFATTSLLTDEQELLTLATHEQVDIARYNPATSRIWHTKNFFGQGVTQP